jgi:antitoxin component YwqK of YwqJK toxin-antitoxin module
LIGYLNDEVVNGTSYSHYDNGQVKMFTYFENEVLVNMKRYFENGDLKFEIEYINGEENILNVYDDVEHRLIVSNGFGKWINLYDNKNIEYEVNVSGGKRIGTSFSYYENGNVDTKYNYVDGKRNGELIRYHDNGNIKVKTNYVNDELNGEYFTYHKESGNILSKSIDLIYRLDYVSIYKAIYSKIDPSPIKSIDFIKKHINQV